MSPITASALHGSVVVLALAAGSAVAALGPAGGGRALAAQEVDGGLADRQPDTERALDVPEIPVDTFRLANGLRVVVSEDHSAPLAAVSVWYGTGRAHEGPGRYGFAALVERLLFQETMHVEPGDADGLITRAGGVYGSDTGPDRTAFYEVVPADRVNLALWLQAERMAGPEITPGTLRTQWGLLEEERRLRLEGQPWARGRIALDSLAFEVGPYRRSALAAPDDPETPTADAVREFHRRGYGPANAVLVVVGDVRLDAMRDLVGEYFGPLEGGEAAAPVEGGPTPPRADGVRRASVDDPTARSPLVQVAYGVPPAGHQDRHALELLATILADGWTSPMRRLLVESGAAREVDVRLDLRVGPGTLELGAVPSEGVDPDRIEHILVDGVDGLVREMTDRGRTRGLNRTRAQLVGRLLTVRGKASALQWHVLHQGSAAELNREMERYAAVTLEDLTRVAATYLVPENRTVVVSRPGGPGEGSGS